MNKQYKRAQPFVGMLRHRPRGALRFECFNCSYEATQRTHGHRYGLIAGPFRTVRGARFVRDTGLITLPVAVAEALAARKNSKGVEDGRAAYKVGKGLRPKTGE